MPYIFYLPSYAATAWYHKVLKERPDNLSSFLEEARKYAQTDYADALMKGSKLGEAEKAAVAKKISRFTGLGEDYLVKANLRVNLPQFMKELQQDRKSTRLNSSHQIISYAVFCLKKKKKQDRKHTHINVRVNQPLKYYVRPRGNDGTQ